MMRLRTFMFEHVYLGPDGADRARADRARPARAVRVVLRAPGGAAGGRRGRLAGRARDRLAGGDDRPLRDPRLDRALRAAGPQRLMARYTQDSRERVRDAVDFAELVGARTELRAAGVRRMQGLCPFHDERTPSFGIDPVEKLYHCFGCGVGGDVFSFVMETEGLDFAGALEALADRYGVKLEREAEDPRDGGAARAARPAARAARAHRRVLRARAVGDRPRRRRRASTWRRAASRRARCGSSGSASRRARTTAWSARRGRPATPRRSWSRAGSRRSGKRRARR